jgi:hypothetical protein
MGTTREPGPILHERYLCIGDYCWVYLAQRARLDLTGQDWAHFTVFFQWDIGASCRSISATFPTAPDTLGLGFGLAYLQGTASEMIHIVVYGRLGNGYIEF